MRVEGLSVQLQDLFSDDAYHLLFMQQPVSSINCPVLLRQFEALVIPAHHFRNDISEADLRPFENHLYYPVSGMPSLPHLLASLRRLRVSVQNLGVVQQGEVLGMFDCLIVDRESFRVGDWVRVIAGEWVNLHGQVVSQDDMLVGVDCRVFRESNILRLPVTALKAQSPPEGPPIGDFTNFVEISRERGTAKAVFLDGMGVIFRALRGYRNHYRGRDGVFIGAAFGAYYSVLKLKGRYPEAEIHMCWDESSFARRLLGEDWGRIRDQIVGDSVKKEEFEYNLQWVARFVRAAGFYNHFVPGRNADDIIASLCVVYGVAEEFDELIIVSDDVGFFQCVSDRVRVLRPKQTDRSYPRVIGVGDVCEEFGVDVPYKVNWVRAIVGGDGVLSAYAWLVREGLKVPRLGYVRKVKAMATRSGSVGEFVGAVRGGIQVLVPFMDVEFDRRVEGLCFRGDVFSGGVTPEVLRGQQSLVFNESGVYDLLKDLGMYKELEHFSRVSMQLRGVWP